MKHIPTGEEVEERFDLVIGADGLRSTVRRLVFGPHERFLKSMNAIICAFQFSEQVPSFKNHDGITLGKSRRALWVFPFEDRPPTALFTYRTKHIDRQFERTPGEVLREVYQDLTESSIVDHALV